MDVGGNPGDVMTKVVVRAVSQAGLDASAQAGRSAAETVLAPVNLGGQRALAVDGPDGDQSSPAP